MGDSIGLNNAVATTGTPTYSATPHPSVTFDGKSTQANARNRYPHHHSGLLFLRRPDAELDQRSHLRERLIAGQCRVVVESLLGDAGLECEWDAGDCFDFDSDVGRADGCGRHLHDGNADGDLHLVLADDGDVHVCCGGTMAGVANVTAPITTIGNDSLYSFLNGTLMELGFNPGALDTVALGKYAQCAYGSGTVVVNPPPPPPTGKTLLGNQYSCTGVSIYSDLTTSVPAANCTPAITGVAAQ